jgi:DNA polymerase III subunit gamma/tau
MAKKKSKRFIIPATHFSEIIIEEKLDIPENSLIASKKEMVNVSLLNETKENYSTGKKNDIKKTKPQNVEEKEIVKPERLNLKKNLPRKSALSLSSLKRNKREEEKQKNKQKVVKEGSDLPNDPFTEETFLKIWEEYIEYLHNNGEKIFASILKADTPKIKKNLICVVYPNEMMKVELIKIKSKALKYLRKKLNNFTLDFQITVNEENTKRFAYTPEEKYELLKEKNKAISVLRKTFNLEL